MKTLNLLLKSLLLLTIIISISSCKKKTGDKDPDELCIEYDGRPEQSISYKEMAIMLNQYKNTREGVLKTALGFEDTHTNWVQIDSLKKYLAYVEKLSNDNGIEITGINIMSAAYPNKSIYGKEKNYQTLILNPTTLKDGNPRVSFDPLNSTNGNPVFVNDLLFPYLSQIDNMSYNKQSDVEDTPSSAFNRMETDPPN
jgi:hypothetical protein